jgi:predicted HicB family RNase H-like nuclease
VRAVKTTTVRIPQDLAAKLKEEAKGNYRSLNAHVLALIQAGRSKLALGKL